MRTTQTSNCRVSNHSPRYLCETEEDELLREVLEGDASACERVVHVYGPRLIAVARRYLRDEADVADCFQETFLKVFQNISRFEQRSTLWTWIRSIAINECLMRLRRARNHPEQEFDELLPIFDESGCRIDLTAPVKGVEETVHGQDIKRAVRQGIDRMPDQYRTVLLLRDIEGYSTDEAATILGIQENAVKTRLHRARSALKKTLEPLLALQDVL